MRTCLSGSFAQQEILSQPSCWVVTSKMAQRWKVSRYWAQVLSICVSYCDFFSPFLLSLLERLVTKANIPSLSDFKRRMKFAKTVFIRMAYSFQTFIAIVYFQVKISASSQFDVILPNLQNDSTDTELTSRYEANCLHVTAKWESVASILQKPPVATSKMTIVNCVFL